MTHSSIYWYFCDTLETCKRMIINHPYICDMTHSCICDMRSSLWFDAFFITHAVSYAWHDTCIHICVMMVHVCDVMIHWICHTFRTGSKVWCIRTHEIVKHIFLFRERWNSFLWHVTHSSICIFVTHLSMFVTRWFMCAFMFRTQHIHWLIHVCGRTLSYMWQWIVHMWSMIFIYVLVLHCTHTYVRVHT